MPHNLAQWFDWVAATYDSLGSDKQIVKHVNRHRRRLFVKALECSSINSNFWMIECV